MDEDHIPATEVDRAPDVIRKAKYEVGRTDILVCGNCHNTFYHIEEFQQHRFEERCIQDSVLRENEKVEPKEQVWAFTLWKNAILNSGKRTEPLTTWTLYKQWCTLDETEREGWIIAGQNLQTFTKLSLSRMHEIRGKTQSMKADKSSTQTPSQTQSNELEEGEVRLSQLTDVQKASIKAQIAANKTSQESTTTDVKKVPLKLAQLYIELLKKPPEMRKALRTGKNSTIEELSFEKILSRRFNHKNRCLEYYVKWDNMKDSDNTWEPKGHFERCRHILDDFDKVFNSSKISNVTDPVVQSETETSSRPARSSKQKAKDQVKSWCDSMSDDDEEEVSQKRMFDDDSDSSDSFEKKMKLEEETESSEEDKPAKKGKVGISVNGIAKKSGDTMPQRIVRVSQKHLPNLSTGVYIMSKTEGIIKLNSDTSLPSTSPLLKVGQRIGQTHIKVVKKDSKGSASKAGKSPMAGLPPVKVITSTGNNLNRSETAEEDESDGIPELEFPTDLPLPEPESPPGDFVLDPLTGKIAGQEYEEAKDNTEVLPESEPEQEPTSLDSLVKMAVSDLPDVEDIPNDDKTSAENEASAPSETASMKPDTTTTIILDSPPVAIKLEPKTISNKEIPEAPSSSKNLAATEIDLESAITLTAIEKIPVTPKPRIRPAPTTATPASILNAALTSSRMPQKKLLSATPSTIRQKVMPHSQMRMPSPTTTIIHKVPGRAKTLPQRMHQQQLIEPTVRRSPTVNTYRPASNVSRRIGNTTIYKTNTKSQFSQPPIKPQPLYKRTFVSRVTSVSTPTPPPISMPLIGIEDEPEAVPSTSAGISDTSESDLLQHLSSDLPTINLADTETPLFITGEDGTIYQVAGQNEEGQTILISEGPDGQQQCVIVTTETAEEEPSQPVVINAPVEAPAEPQPQQTKMEVDESETDELGDDSQVVAQIVKADPPSPGGTRKVVLMLPDGNLMMTDVTAEQYAALELDK